MKFIKIFIPLFLVFTLVSSIIQPIIENSQSITDKVFRLHIVANSDSAEDQSTKLKLRDFILISTQDLFNADTLDENVLIAKDNLDVLKINCEKYLKSIGCNDSVQIEVTEEYFDTRVYDDFTLPAGIYNSLRLEIGEGRGHNWWCIIFPSVCLSSCSKSLEEYLNDDEMKIIESGYSPKFKIVEIYQKLKNKSIDN
ncbi:MAG: stage II sporulation protein R [Eubacterium sp.]|nr:stage II sporulation protein R [Eubacterium sp.]